MKITTKKLDRYPTSFTRALAACFGWIQLADVAGLDHIEILPTISDLSQEPEWWQKTCNKDATWVKAIYYASHDDEPASIIFFLDAMYFPLPSVLRIRPITTLYFAHIVAHEVAHHLVGTRGYVFAPGEVYKSEAYEEEMANRYAFEIVERMKSKWYYRIADRFLKFISQVHFEDGRQNWLSKNYNEASTCWYKAWLLDFDNEKAGELYWTAKEKANHVPE